MGEAEWGSQKAEATRSTKATSIKKRTKRYQTENDGRATEAIARNQVGAALPFTCVATQHHRKMVEKKSIEASKASICCPLLLFASVIQQTYA